MLAGDGASFCAGADVEWQRSSIDLSYDENVEDAMRLYRMLEAIDSCPAPVACLVHGHALGGGSGLVACADVAVAHPDTVFGFPEVRLGIIPAVISPVRPPQARPGGPAVLPHRGALRADAALRIGLVHEVSAATEETVSGIVDALLAGGPQAVREAELLVRDRPGGPRRHGSLLPAGRAPRDRTACVRSSRSVHPGGRPTSPSARPSTSSAPGTEG